MQEEKPAEPLYTDNDFENIVDISPYPILIHKMGVMRYANELCVEMFELETAEQVIGTNLLQYIHPDDRQILMEAIAKGATEKVRYTLLNARMVTAKGRVVNTQTKSASLRFRGEDCRLAVAYEYDHHTKVEEELKNKNLILEKIAEILPDSFIVVDNKTREVIFENKSLLDTLGYTSQDLNGYEDQFDFIQHLIHKEDLRKLVDARKDLFDENKRGSYVATEYRVKDKSGKWRWILSRSTLFRKLDGKGHQLSFGIAQDITLLKEYEQQLTEQKQLLDKITATIPNHISIYDIASNKSVYYNVKLAHILGYPADYENDNPLDRFHPDYLPTAIDSIRKIAVLKEGEIFSTVGEYRNADGSKRKMLTRATPFLMNEDGSVKQALVSITDLQELESTQLKLEASEEKRKAILYALPDLLFQINAQGFVTDFYPNIDSRDILERMQFIGKNVREIVPEENALDVLKMIGEVLSTGEMKTMEYVHEGTDGPLHYEFRAIQVNSAEVIIVVRDVNSLRSAQNQLQQKLNEISEKNTQLEKYITSNTELEKFAYIASHDLREPIRSIVGFTQLLQKRNPDNIDTDSKEFLANIISSAQHMNKLVHGLLDFSRVESAGRRFVPINLNDLLKKVLNDLKVSIEENDAVIEIAELPEIRADEIQIRQLFQNLISNAIKFRKEDETPVVKVSALKKEDEWLFTIADNGIGMDMKYSKKVFQIFSRLHSSEKYHGTGIGLAVCKKIVERHGGDIWIESTPGNGATFYFTVSG
ncbi:MAG: PAS domain S-box protein [Chitinophagales bacterium]|nr:PAS domain S-box protein [Chitinophagales bacterium]